MQTKTTKKQVLQDYKCVISVSFKALQNLLYFRHPCKFTWSNTGWCADVYDFGSIAIVTGYLPFGNVKASYELCKKYDSKAYQVLCSTCTTTEQMYQINDLLVSFLDEVLK